MKNEWLLRAASLLAPQERRAEWLEEWRSELWYVPRRQATSFCLGAFRDALWLRRNSRSTGAPLESPLSCLAFLSTVAALCLFAAVCLSGPLGSKSMYSHLGKRDLPIALFMTLGLTFVLSPATMAFGQTPPWPITPRWGIFLVLKIVLVQPILLCCFMIWILIAPVAPFAPFGILGACILTLRWVFTDQRQRCPVCLRLLTQPVRIGTPSETFLAWYGAETICARGHGLMHISEVSASYSQKAQWLGLDASWSGLFSSLKN